MMSKKYFQIIALSAVIGSISYGNTVWAAPKVSPPEEICTKKVLGLTCKISGCTWLPKAVGNLKKGCHNVQIALVEHSDCMKDCGDEIDQCLKQDYKVPDPKETPENLTKAGNKLDEKCKPNGDKCYIDKCGLATNDPFLYRNSKKPNSKNTGSSKTSATSTKEGCEKQYGRPCRDVCNKKYLESKMKENRIKRGISEGKVTNDDRDKEEKDFSNCKKECETNLNNCQK